MTDEYFCNLKLKFPFMDRIYDELTNASWYMSRFNQCRSDASITLRKLIQEIVPFQINCCGFFKNEPEWIYPVHKDTIRLAAINILLVDQCDDFQVNFYSDDFSKKISVPYTRDELILINTKKFHSVVNRSLNKTRFIMTVGCITEGYIEIKKKFNQHDM